MPPTAGQLILLGAAAVVLAAGGAASLVRLWRPGRVWAPLGRVCLAVGLILAVGVLGWRIAAEASGRGSWVPLGDNFDALVSLAILLSGFVIYVQSSTRMGGVDWFVMPVVVLLLVLAAVFGRAEYQEYGSAVRETWVWVHYATAFLGAAAFAIAAAAGAMYVLTSRKLRRKAVVGPAFGSLERLERLTMRFVILGFALLTLGAISGLVPMIEAHRRTSTSKLVLATAAWLVYAVVLHAPINPSFRGRKVAILSIFGFLLMVGTVLAVLLTGGQS